MINTEMIKIPGLYFIEIEKKYSYSGSDINNYVTQIIEKYGKGVSFIYINNMSMNVDVSLSKNYDFIVSKDKDLNLIETIMKKYKWGHISDRQDDKVYLIFTNAGDAAQCKLFS